MANLIARQIIDDIKANDYDALIDWLHDGNFRINALGDMMFWDADDEKEFDEIFDNEEIGEDVIIFIRDYALSSGLPTKWDP